MIYLKLVNNPSINKETFNDHDTFNGINDDTKQMKLVKFLKEKAIDIALIQEHNIKSKEKIEYLLQFYNIILNKSILSKGGTLILIDKRLPARVCSSYLHPTSRITTAVLNIMGANLFLVNVYAPSGKNKGSRANSFRIMNFLKFFYI